MDRTVCVRRLLQLRHAALTGRRSAPSAPSPGCIEYVDAAISKNGRLASAAAVARATAGNFLGASAVVMEGLSDTETMEAMACREGLALASDLLLQNFKMASDCRNVVRSIKESGMGRYGHVVKEISARMESFASAELVHEGRCSNVDAHVLAKGSLYHSLGRHV